MDRPKLSLIEAVEALVNRTRSKLLLIDRSRVRSLRIEALVNRAPLQTEPTIVVEY